MKIKHHKILLKASVQDFKVYAQVAMKWFQIIYKPANSQDNINRLDFLSVFIRQINLIKDVTLIEMQNQFREMFKNIFNDPIFGDLVVPKDYKSENDQVPLLRKLKKPESTNSQNISYQATCSKSQMINFQKEENGKLYTKKTHLASESQRQDIYCCPCESINGNCFMCYGGKNCKCNQQLAQFFQYIIDFKMGKIDTYQSSLKKQQWEIWSRQLNLPKDAVDSNMKRIIKSTNYRSSILSNSKKLTQSSIKEKCQKQKFRHQGFNCDQCGQQPIIGPRYHCIEGCQDFDLCQTCHQYRGHSHQMKQYKLSGTYSQIKCVMNTLTKSMKISKKNNVQEIENQEDQARPNITYNSSIR